MGTVSPLRRWLIFLDACHCPYRCIRPCKRFKRGARNGISGRKGIHDAKQAHGNTKFTRGQWLDAHHPRSKEEWVKLFRQTFRFTGGEIVGEFLMSTGYLPGAHREGCPVLKRIRRASPKPAWTRSRSRTGTRSRTGPLSRSAR